MPDLSVDVDRNDIVVSTPSSGLSVTYRRAGRVLVVLDSMRNDPEGSLFEHGTLPWPRLSRSAGSINQNAAWAAEVRTTLVVKF